MIHLMALELKKVHFKKYILFSMLAILLSMYFIFVALNDSSKGNDTFETTFRVIEMIFSFVFVIFFSVLNSSLILSEYNHKTILLMFTYPIERKKVILSKLLLITLFVAASMLLGFIACCSFLVWIDHRFDLLAGGFETSLLYEWIPRALSTTVVFCALGLWTFVVGMWKKSISMTIVSSIIFIFLRQLIIASTDTYRESPVIILSLLAVTAAAMFLTFQKNITAFE